MTNIQLQSISLKVLVDKEKNRVVFAESDKDFVDVLFSFLTMPIGTIIRLIRSQSFVFGTGCMNNLYESVDKLDVQHLCTPTCKTMLLSPRSSAETHSRSLKVNIDDTEPTQYYRCISGCVNSVYKNVRCYCGKMTEREYSIESSNPANGEKGVFVKEATRFMISDDLHVTLMSTMTSLSLLSKLGIKTRRSVEEKTVNIEENVLQLLMSLLSSETPLTNSVFLERVIVDQIQFDPRNTTQPIDERDADSDDKKLRVKLLVSKSNNKVLYAEGREDFGDLIISFLTFPLGSIVDLLGGNSPWQCVNALYKSVEHLNINNLIKSDECKNMLIHPKLAPYFGCDNQLLGIEEAIHPHATSRQNYFHVLNPKLLTIDTRRGGGFLKGPAMFMVTDDLVVTPLSSISAINSFNVPLSDIEERVVTVGKKEALRLLKASLFSKSSALTDAFSLKFRPKRPKQEV
ncbi:hypothetical protein HHK36_018906 [Tetracentron sinense]|uniref:DUF674 family protein n=1 Tax=Tetracentron sinense TaxID=13715 RepID=A0A835DBQ6_TETSI|nr:hypothetical protein HHK36_018906 [Tetracentron sinense]